MQLIEENILDLLFSSSNKLYWSALQNQTANSVKYSILLAPKGKFKSLCKTRTKNNGFIILPSFAWNAGAKIDTIAVNSRGRNE